MSKLYFYDKKIENNILPNIDNALTNLNNADKIIDSLVIPSNFNYSNSLKRCINDISSINTKLKNAKNWLVQSKTEYSSSMNQIRDDISKLSSFNLEVRQRKVVR